jgi:hypothetical protein
MMVDIRLADPGFAGYFPHRYGVVPIGGKQPHGCIENGGLSGRLPG